MRRAPASWSRRGTAGRSTAWHSTRTAPWRDQSAWMPMVSARGTRRPPSHKHVCRYLWPFLLQRVWHCTSASMLLAAWCTGSKLCKACVGTVLPWKARARAAPLTVNTCGVTVAVCCLMRCVVVCTFRSHLGLSHRAQRVCAGRACAAGAGHRLCTRWVPCRHRYARTPPQDALKLALCGQRNILPLAFESGCCATYYVRQKLCMASAQHTARNCSWHHLPTRCSITTSLHHHIVPLCLFVSTQVAMTTQPRCGTCGSARQSTPCPPTPPSSARCAGSRAAATCCSQQALTDRWVRAMHGTA